MSPEFTPRDMDGTARNDRDSAPPDPEPVLDQKELIAGIGSL